MPIFANKEDLVMLTENEETRKRKAESQRRSQEVKKKKHGRLLTLVSLGDKTESRGGKKSRRKVRTHKWVDPEMVGALPQVPTRRARRVRAR